MNLNLSTPQRELIRAIHDAHSDGDPLGSYSFSKRTSDSLRRRGYIEFRSGDEVEDHTQIGWYLTSLGEGAYRRIMRSGDGPEALKAMFRF